MTDIEIKRKELETAKRIRDNGYTCTNDDNVVCNVCKPMAGGECRVCEKEFWDAFIATRDSELAALDKGAETPESKYTQKPYYSGCTIGVTPDSPSIDAFALALIQGGYYQRGNIDDLIQHAEKIKEVMDGLRAEKDKGE